MIDNFDEVKAQLEQLAPVINSFQSEAVQLRIVEIVLGGASTQEVDGEEADTGGAAAPKRRTRRRPRAAETAEGAAPSKPRTSGGKPSAGATLDRLISDGFFKSPRVLADIVSHAATDLALPYKQSDFSPALVRAVRDAKLKRTKSEAGQFQYEQP